jgi:RNA polymerase sigma-54 factor
MFGPQVQAHPGARVDARLITANNVIQYSAPELEQALTRELDENPALELVERVACPLCATPLQFGVCPSCSEGESIRAKPQKREAQSSEGDLDPILTIAAPLTLAEQLLGQLRLAVDRRDHKIAAYVVGNLDEHGYLVSSVEELSQLLQVEVNRVQYVVDELQGLDPPGIGARNVTECLLIQVQRLARQGISVPPITPVLLREHLEALGHQHFERIRQALQVSREEVEVAFDFIRTNLHPYPAHHHYAQVYDSTPVAPLAVPSVLIHRSEAAGGDYEVEVIESQRLLLRINPLYQRLRQQPYLISSPGEREHITHYLDRARLFISALQRRYLLLHKVTSYLVTYQSAFLDSGPSYLRPLTQSAVAQELNIHVSLVSRATAGKYGQLPSRELLPLSRFFAAEKRVQELIRQMVAQEVEPLSDANIARLLTKEYGVSLSRQMVAIYRMELAIPSARQRTTLRRGKKHEHQTNSPSSTPHSAG